MPAVAVSKHSLADIERIQKIIQCAAKNSPYESEETHQVNDGFMRLITAQEYLDEVEKQNMADYSAPISMWIRRHPEAESKSSSTDETMTEFDHNVSMYSSQSGYYEQKASEGKRSRIKSCHTNKNSPLNCVRVMKPGGYQNLHTPPESPKNTRYTNRLAASSFSNAETQYSPASVSDVTSTAELITQEWPSIYNKSNGFNSSGNSTHKLGMVCMESDDIPYETDSMA